MNRTAAAVRKAFFAAGFDAVAVTSADPVRTEALQRWLKRGWHAEMKWMERSAESRGDPRRLLPGARSVISAAAAYGEGWDSEVGTGPPRGLVAAYAQGPDYHRVLRERAQEAVSSLREELGGDFRAIVAVDSAPLLERELAVRAGLGRTGRNGLLITSGYGSCILLAEVITERELEPFSAGEIPLLECGSCRRCIEACPTGAIREDGLVDARRCVAYLTVEHKGAIPAELRPLMGQWVFGCDVCQRVCPHNRGRRPPRRPFVGQDPGRFVRPLAELLALSPQEFRRLFAGTPVERIGYRRFLRNVCVAAGNAGDRALTGALEAVLARETDPVVTEHAQWALDRLRSG